MSGSSEDFKVKIASFLDTNEKIKNLKKELKDLTQKKQRFEEEIKNWMISNEKQQIKSELGNIVLYNKKVSKGGFSKDLVKEKISNEMGELVNHDKLEKLAENLFKKEFDVQEALKVVKKNN